MVAMGYYYYFQVYLPTQVPAPFRPSNIGSPWSGRVGFCLFNTMHLEFKESAELSGQAAFHQGHDRARAKKQLSGCGLSLW
jgi:hypothetical protein